MATLQGNQGQASKQIGQNVTLGFGEFSEALVSELQARYYENVYRGNVFTASNTAALALSLNSATATGLILSNPAGSGKNLVLLEALISVANLPAGQSTLILTANINPIAAATVHTTPLVIANALLGSANASVAKADSAATLPVAPTIIRSYSFTAATVAASTSFPPFIKDDIGGAIIVAPGCTVSIQCLVTAATTINTLTWAEVAI
jgi:hypothetical protein